MADRMIAYAGELTLQNATDMNSGASGATEMMLDTGQETETFNASFICRSQDDLMKSRIVSTVHAFVNACVPSSEEILSDNWNLCTSTGQFDCTDVHKYTAACQFAKQSTRCPSTTPLPHPAPCGIDQMVDQTSGILLLIGILFLGVLIGIASTVAVCLMCPKIHSWMISKLQTKVKITREKSYETDYTDIDDSMVGSVTEYRPSDVALYNVSNVSSISSDYTGSDCDIRNILYTLRQSGRSVPQDRDCSRDRKTNGNKVNSCVDSQCCPTTGREANSRRNSVLEQT